MAIVRELQTKLSFKVDKKGIENFKRSIVSVKKQFLIASTLVTGFIAGFVKTTSAISNTILEMDLLSRSTGISLEKLIALERVASRVGIDKSQFRSGISFLNQKLREAEQGIGSFREEAKTARVDVLDVKGRALPTEQVFKDFIKRISEIKDETARFAKAKEIFGSELFADIALDAIPQAEKESKKLAQTFRENTENARKFREEMSKLGEAFSELLHEVFPPILSFITRALADITQNVKNIKSGTFLENALEDVAEEARAFDKVFGFLRPLAGLFSLVPVKSRENVNINTKIEMTVPEGTRQEQLSFLRDSAQEAFTEGFVNEMQKIGNNFPITA